MKPILENILLKVPPGVVYDIRKIHNFEKPGMIEQAINILEEWILKQDHIIKKDFSKEYLEKTLINCKGSVEKSKKLIDRLCTMKTLIPKFFSKTNAKMELPDVLKMGKLVPLPILTDDFCRIVIGQLTGNEFTNETFLQYFQYSVIEGYGARLKSIYMITESKAIELLINIIKQFVSDKIGNRIVGGLKPYC